MRYICAMSIWATGAIPPDEWKYRNLKRIMFPVIDLFFIMAGLFAFKYGIYSIGVFFPDYIIKSFSLFLSAISLVCLIGVSFPRLWVVEMIGKSVLLGLMVGYFVSLSLLAAVGQGHREFDFLVAGIALCPIIWRLSLLGSEWQARRLSNRGDNG